MTTTPTLSSLIADAVREVLSDLWVSGPARVESYDANRHTITAKLLLRRPHITEDGEITYESPDVITNVPVVYQGSSRGRLTIPPEVGDTVLLVFCSGDIGPWISHGREADPIVDHRGDLTDAIAITGLWSPSQVTPAVTEAAVLEHEDVRLGSSDASEDEHRVATKADLNTLMTVIQNNAGAGIGFGAAVAADLTAANWPTCALRVRAK